MCKSIVQIGLLSLEVLHVPEEKVKSHRTSATLNHTGRTHDGHLYLQHATLHPHLLQDLQKINVSSHIFVQHQKLKKKLLKS